MGYFIFTIAFFTALIGTALYITRQRWLSRFRDSFDEFADRLPHLDSLYRYAPLPTSFREDVEAGLHSTNFDMTGNIEEDDTRSGLDDKSKAEVLRIMKRRKVNFDEARRIWIEQRMRKQGIGADGLPNDPKLVTFG